MAFHPPPRRRALAVLLLSGAIATAALAPLRAAAHAVLLESTPPDGAIVSSAPHAAVLRFNSRIEKRLTRVALTDAKGRAVPLPAGPYGADDPPDRLTIPLPPLPQGAYRLTYRVLAVDGHATPGLLRFTVQPAGAAQ
jgi:methionine-rich copper-binding protein CopC